MGWFVLFETDWIDLLSQVCSFLLLVGFAITCLLFAFAKKHEVRLEPKITTEEQAWKQINGRFNLDGGILFPVDGYIKEELDEEALDFLLKHKNICYLIIETRLNDV